MPDAPPNPSKLSYAHIYANGHPCSPGPTPASANAIHHEQIRSGLFNLGDLSASDWRDGVCRELSGAQST
jgi:hypothetical protein